MGSRGGSSLRASGWVVGADIVDLSLCPVLSFFSEKSAHECQEIQVDRRYMTHDVSHLFPTPPAEAAMRWARDRLTAAGGEDRLFYEVREASALELPLEPESGLTRFFADEQVTRLDLRLLVRVRLRDERGLTRSTVEVEASRSVTVPEYARLHDGQLRELHEN